jgi:hypothetical protein
MTGKKLPGRSSQWPQAWSLVLVLLMRAHRLRLITERQSIPIEGAVIQRDADPNKELPIADVAITASDGVRAPRPVRCCGIFQACPAKGVLSDRPVTVSFPHPNYEPLDLTVQTGRLATPKQLYVAAMVPLPPKT